MSEIINKLNLNKNADGSWLYAYGLLAGREKYFFDESQLQQLLNANSESEFLNLIQSANYSGDTIEEALINSQHEDLDLIYSIVPDFTLLELFILFNDAHNLKVFLRTILPAREPVLIKDIEYLFLRPYLTEPQQILFAVQNIAETSNDDSELNKSDLTDFEVPDWLNATIKQAENIYLETYDMSRVDLVVEQALWCELLSLLSNIKSDWLTEYYLLKADLINLEILLRCKNVNLSQEFFKRSILQQGNISQEQWLGLFSFDGSELAAKIKLLGFGDFSEMAEIYHKPGSASIFSQLADNRLMQKIQETKYFASGVEKVAAYYLVREMERRNIRLIRAFHLKLIPQERTYQIIRSSYAGV
ncbi:MAG TPA: V-type ATPase subunit [Clostridiaceae bacterium]|nr:V-type ATPase subunit [Clostridiaceae bacterium]